MTETKTPTPAAMRQRADNLERQLPVMQESTQLVAMLHAGADALEREEAHDEELRQMQDRLQRLIDGSAAKDAEIAQWRQQYNDALRREVEQSTTLTAVVARLTRENFDLGCQATGKRDLQFSLQTMESALAAERQKVQALREQVEAVIDSPLFTDSVRQSYRNMLIAMDVIWLTADAPVREG